LRPLLAGVSPDIHHASGVSVGDDDAERAGGIVHGEDTLVESAAMPWRPAARHEPDAPLVEAMKAAP
jgi:hypothetical protein